MSLKNPYNAAKQYDEAVAWNQGVIDVLEELCSPATVRAGAAGVSPVWSWDQPKLGADARAVLEAARRRLSEEYDAA